jgi:hypothetical protein
MWRSGYADRDSARPLTLSQQRERQRTLRQHLTGEQIRRGLPLMSCIVFDRVRCWGAPSTVTVIARLDRDRAVEYYRTGLEGVKSVSISPRKPFPTHLVVHG